MEYYLYRFKRWLLRDEKLTHQEAALGIFLTLITIACGYFAIQEKFNPSIAPKTTDPQLTTSLPAEAALLDPATPYLASTDSVSQNPDSLAKPALITENKPPVKKTAANKLVFKKNLKAKPQKISDEKRVIRMLEEGKSVWQIARQTGLKKKFIRQLKRDRKKKV